MPDVDTPPKPPTTEVGQVAPWATSINGWPIDEAEFNAALTWPNSVKTYDWMLRFSQVRAVVSAVTLPLRRDIWRLDPQGARPDVVEQCARDFDLPILGQPRRPPERRKGRFSWAEHNRLALISLTHGHMAFVQVAEWVPALNRYILRKLSPRFPQTIKRIDVDPDGGLVGIRQWQTRGTVGPDNEVEIGVERLLFYSTERLGGAWQGQSILRSAFMDVLLLERAIKGRSMTNQRNGMGVPIVTAPPGATQPQIDEMNAMAQRYQGGIGAGGALPHGGKLELQGVKGSLPDVSAEINDLRAQIAKNVLATFLELGTGPDASGHRALAESFLDFFTQSLDTHAASFASTFTAHAIEDWVTWNYGTDEPAPALVARPVDAEQDLPVEQLVSLLEVGAIEMTDTLERFLLERYRLPAPTEGEPVRPPPRSTPKPPEPVAATRDVSRGQQVRAAAESTWRTRIADAMAALVDAPNIAAAIAGGEDPNTAITAGVATDPGELEEVLIELWEEHYAEGESDATTVAAARGIPRGSRGNGRRVMASFVDLLRDARDSALGMVATLRDRLTSAVEAAQEEEPDRSVDAYLDLLTATARRRARGAHRPDRDPPLVRARPDRHLGCPGRDRNPLGPSVGQRPRRRVR